MENGNNKVILNKKREWKYLGHIRFEKFDNQRRYERQEWHKEKLNDLPKDEGTGSEGDSKRKKLKCYKWSTIVALPIGQFRNHLKD